ncbi:MAG: hypothetical protein K0U98_19705 [Deltaproteobacteria bacterium]|nr:hypothetical protein [Deltaproteobacteria bacterium]
MHLLRNTVVFLLAFLVTLPALAYKIYLKDGSFVVAQEKYKIVGDKAILTLGNGTQVSYDAAEIDVERTNNSNQTDYGSAIIVNDGKAEPLAKKLKPEPKKATLSDLIKQRKAGIRRPEVSQRSGSAASSAETKPAVTGPTVTATGASDFGSLKETTHSNGEIVSEIQQYFRSQGVAEMAVYRGTTETRPLVQVNTNSEAAVFRALTVASNALLEIRARHGQALTGFDLLLKGVGASRAGQFSLDPNMASELVDKKIEAASFFVKYVDF